MTRTTMKKTLTCSLFAIGIWSCGGPPDDGGGGTTPNPTPTIAITLSQTSATVQQGGSVTVTGTVAPGGGFTGNVTVTVEGVPTGVTGSVGNVQALSADVTVDVGANVAPGNYTLTVRATGTGVTDATVSFALTVTAAPSYSLALAPDTLTIDQGSSDVTQVTLVRTNFTADVVPSAGNLPAGMTATFNPDPIAGDTSIVTIAVGGSVAVGSYTVTITGVATGLTDRTDTLEVIVTAPSSPTYAMALMPDSLSIEQGQNDVTQVDFVRFNFTGGITLAFENAPAGVTTSFNPTSPVAVDSSIATVTVSGAVAPGQYAIPLRGTAAGLTDRFDTLHLTVTPAPAYTLTLFDDTLTIEQGSNDSTVVSLVRTNFTGDVTLAAENLPTGVQTSFGPNPATADSSSFKVSLVSSVVPGSYSVVVRGTAAGGMADRTDTLTLIVTVPVGFSFESVPDLTVQQGMSGTRDVVIVRTGGFSGSVTVTVTDLSPGLTATVNPQSTTGDTVTINVTASASLATQTYLPTIRGNATGFTEVTTGMDVNVVSGSSNVSYDFSGCAMTERPIWFAFQDGTGAWTRVTGALSVFDFNVTQSKAGIAYVTQGIASTVLNVEYVTQAEAIAFGAAVCATGSATKTINATAAGLMPGQAATVHLGGAFGFAGANTAFQIMNVRSGTFDLIGVVQTLANPGTADRMLLRRDQNIADGGSLGTVDFAGGESFALDTATITIGGSMVGDTVTAAMMYSTASGANSCQAAFINFASPLVGTTFTAYGAPSANQDGDDFHQVTLAAAGANGGSRAVFEYFHTLGARTVNLPSVVPTPTISTLAGSYKRLEAAVTVPAEYNGGALFAYDSGTKSVEVNATAGWVGGTAVTLGVPDLSGLSAWDDNWVPGTGDAVTWDFDAFGGPFTQRCTENGRILVTTVSGTN